MSDEKLLQLGDISNYKYCGSVLFVVYSASELQRIIDQRDRLLAEQQERIAELEAELAEAKRVTFDQAVLERMNALEAELSAANERAEFGWKTANINEKARQAMMAERDAARKDHLELLYAVSRKYPGESRHQTALRYITEAEERSLTSDAAIAAKEKP
jgi:hypothetical protein